MACSNACRVAGLIIESGFSDPLAWAQKRFGNMAEEFKISEEVIQSGMVHPLSYHTDTQLYLNHEEKIKKYPGNILLIHTKDDRIVPFSQAEQNFKWAKERTIPNAEDCVTFVPFEAGDHNYIWPMNHEEYVKQVAQFVQKCGHKFPKDKEGCVIQ